MKFVEVQDSKKVKLAEPIIFGLDYQSIIEENLLPKLDDWQTNFVKDICQKGIQTEKQLDKYFDIIRQRTSNYVDLETGETLFSVLAKYLYCDSI